MQTTLGVDVLGVVRPEALRAVAATRTGRIGLLATPTTVASGAYEEAVRAIDPYVTLHAVPCPGLAAIIQAGEQFDERAVATGARRLRAAARGRSGHRDPRLHALPADRPMLQRMLGPASRSSAPAPRSRARSSMRSPPASCATRARSEGDYRFLCTGDAEAFHELGTRFLQMPLGTVERVELAEVGVMA